MFGKDSKILIVDDVMAMRFYVKKTLEELGYHNFTQARDGEEALSMLREANPPFELVFTDWNMPNLTGDELIKEVRNDNNLSETPIILVTSDSHKENILKAIKLGVSNYLTKPFNSSDMTKTLLAAFEKHHKK